MRSPPSSGGKPAAASTARATLAVRARHGIARAIYVNGHEIGWGNESPREGLREAFRAALTAG